MKWIGQHIWDFISRFRNDVYLENLSTTTETNILVVDSSGKVSKNTTTVGGDITGVTITTDSGGGSAASDTNGSADFNILGATGVGVTNSGTTITATAVPAEIDHDSLLNFVAAEHYRWDNNISGIATIHTNNITDLHGAGVDGSANQLLTDDGDGTVTSEAGFTWDGDDMLVTSATSQKPVVELKNTNTDGHGPELKLSNTKGGSTDGVDGDYAGKITFHAVDDGTPTTQQYGEIGVRSDDVTSTEESGLMFLQVANHDGGLNNGLVLQGGDVDAEVDVAIGSGAASLTTVSGDLRVTSKATMPSRVYAYPGTSDGDHTAGDIMYYDSATASTTAGKIYYFNGSGSWTIANADAVADATGMLAVALGNDPDVDGMLLRGFVTLYDINGTEDHGAKLYLHTADGEASATAPGSGNVVRVLGYNLHNTNDSVYFNPDNSWVEVS